MALLCSLSLFAKNGQQIPQQTVVEVGEIFKKILKEVSFKEIEILLVWFISIFPLLLGIDYCNACIGRPKKLEMPTMMTCLFSKELQLYWIHIHIWGMEGRKKYRYSFTNWIMI